jgi:signal peptidase I
MINDSSMKDSDFPQPNDPIRPRNSFIAALLSLLIPGLGQIYCGRARRGFTQLVFLVVCETLVVKFGLFFYFYGLVVFVLADLVIRIYVIVDAVRLSRNQAPYQLKWYNTWYYHGLIGVGIFAILFVKGSLIPIGFKTFIIPTTSMEPTLKLGDWIVADMRPAPNRELTYGDIVVYQPTDLREVHPCRVVGLPGDTLELQNDFLIINGKPTERVLIRELYTEPAIASYIGPETEEYAETFANGRTVHVFKSKKLPDNNQAKQNISKVVLPPGQYCLLGDNRDNAADSRYRGFVPRENILGFVCYSYWGKTHARINISFRNK